MFAVAAKHGDEESAISSIIGRHPTDSLMVILDEATDLNPAIVKAFPNLDSSEKPFQLIAIGNSNSIHDLHGSICTPKKGWASVDPYATTNGKPHERTEYVYSLAATLLRLFTKLMRLRRSYSEDF